MILSGNGLGCASSPYPVKKMNSLKGRSKVEMLLLFCPPRLEAKELTPLHHSPPKKGRKEGKKGRRKRETEKILREDWIMLSLGEKKL